MSGRKKFPYRAAGVILPLILIISAAGCSGNSAGRLAGMFDQPPVPLEEQLPDLAGKLADFSEMTGKLLPSIEYDDFQYIDLPRDNIGWKVYGPESVKYLWNIEDLKKITETEDLNSKEIFIEKIYHLEPENPEQSPVTPGLKNAPDSEVLLWLLEEGFRKLDTENISHQEYTEFIIRKAAERIILDLKGPASGELAEFRAETHDMITWANLAGDLVVQIKSARTTSVKGPDFDYETVRKKIIKDWLNDYRFFYADRFITNRYLQFGEKAENVEFTDIELFSLNTEAADWPSFEKEYKNTGSDPAEFFTLIYNSE